jgi:hypothetical protein
LVLCNTICTILSLDKFNTDALTGEKPDESGGDFAAGNIWPVNEI